MSKPGLSLCTIAGQPSWRIASSTMEAYVTQRGGHLAPVTFNRNGRRIQPYAIAPWAEEPLPRSMPSVLQSLRGDFFCLPFGGNSNAWRGEKHPVHGETANVHWKFEELKKANDHVRLHLSLATKVRTGRVDKEIKLVEGHNAVYVRHTVSGMSGPMCLGHHAMLRFPDYPSSGLVSTSGFQYGQVFTEPVELPENRGYSMLKPGAEFDSLGNVPTITGENTDLSRYPARRGYEDLVALACNPDLPFAWTAVSFPKEGYVWFALKDPRILRNTILWFSNGGRHYPPWNGRHINVLGLEETTSYFHRGLKESAERNAWSDNGHGTALKLSKKKPLVVNYVMAVAEIPRDFGQVVEIIPEAGNTLVIRGSAGRSAKTQADISHLQANA